VLGGNHLKVITKVPLSYSAVSRRIEFTGCDIECELIKQFKSSQGFSVQVDESSDIAGLSALLAFV
jgi:hypothetical protein